MIVCFLFCQKQQFPQENKIQVCERQWPCWSFVHQWWPGLLFCCLVFCSFVVLCFEVLLFCHFAMFFLFVVGDDCHSRTGTFSFLFY